MKRFWIFFGIFVFGLMMLHLYLSSMVIDLSYKNTEKKIALDKLQSENRRQRALLAQKTNFAALEQKAKEMGFHPPHRIYYLVLPTKESETR